MRTLNLRMNFFWDDGDDIKCFKLTVPDDTTDDEVIDILKKEHEYLCTDDDEDIYFNKGRNPETLLDYVCDKYYGWSCSDLQYDIDLNFN